MAEPEAVPVLVMRNTDDPAQRPTFDTPTVPLAAVDTVRELRHHVDAPADFHAVYIGGQLAVRDLSDDAALADVIRDDQEDYVIAF